MEKCDRTKINLSEKFEILMSCLDKNFLEIKAHALLKVATKGSFRIKKIQRFNIFRLSF